MEWSDTHVEILQIIHDSPNHGINAGDMVSYQLEYPGFRDILEDLIDRDFVEFELRENTYYLDNGGFEVLERLEELKKNGHKKPQSNMQEYEEIVDEFGGAKRFKKLTIMGVLAFGILGSLWLYKNPKPMTKEQQNLKNILDEEAIKKIENQVMEAIDSLQNSRNE